MPMLRELLKVILFPAAAEKSFQFPPIVRVLENVIDLAYPELELLALEATRSVSVLGTGASLPM